MKRSKLPSLVAVLILTLITAVMWVGLSVYRALSLKPAESVPQEILQPLDPNLDSDTLGKIQSKIFLDDSQIPEVAVSQTNAPVATKAPQASPQASPSATPVSTTAPEPSPT